MKNKKKAGLLILILAVPAFVVLIGNFFKTEHKFELPYFGDHPIKHVSLRSLNGNTRFLGNDLSTITIVSFHCQEEQDITNRVLSELTTIQEFYAKSPSVKLISIFCCDEEKTYLTELSQLYSVEKSFWVFTWPEDSLNTIINTFGVELDRDANNYKEQAFSSIYLLDKKMMIRGFYNGYSKDDINKLIEDVRVLIHEYK